MRNTRDASIARPGRPEYRTLARGGDGFSVFGFRFLVGRVGVGVAIGIGVEPMRRVGSRRRGDAEEGRRFWVLGFRLMVSGSGSLPVSWSIPCAGLARGDASAKATAAKDAETEADAANAAVDAKTLYEEGGRASSRAAIVDQANVLTTEAESHLAPILIVEVTAGSATVTATLSDGLRNWTTPATVRLVSPMSNQPMVGYPGIRSCRPLRWRCGRKGVMPVTYRRRRWPSQAPVRPRHLHHGFDVRVRRVARNLVAGGKDEAAAGGRVVDRPLGGLAHLGHGAAQQDVGGVQVVFEADTVTEADRDHVSADSRRSISARNCRKSPKWFRAMS